MKNVKKCYRLGCFDFGTESYSNKQSVSYGDPVCIFHQHCECVGEFVCDRCYAVSDKLNKEIN